MANAHSDLVHMLLMKLSMPGCRVWKNATGVGRSMQDDDAVIAYGLKGSADITGIILCKSGIGVRLEVECKTGTGRLRVEQKNFRDMILAMGGLHIEARDVESVVAEVKKFQENH